MQTSHKCGRRVAINIYSTICRSCWYHSVRVTKIWDKRKKDRHVSIKYLFSRFAAPKLDQCNKAMFTRAAGHPAGELESKWKSPKKGELRE